MNVRFYLSYDSKITLKSHFCSKDVIILPICTKRCFGHHSISRKLVYRFYFMALFHGFISLPDPMSYDKYKSAKVKWTVPRSALGILFYCRSKGCEFDPGLVPYFCGD